MNKLHVMAVAIALAAIVSVTAEETPLAFDASAPSAAPWTTVAASGLVEVRNVAADEDWVRVKRGARLQERATLRTGQRGRATLTRNADLLIVDPNSRIELPALRVRPEDESTVIQNEGSVVYEVDGRTTRNFKVVTPYLVAGVKGTVFMVTVADGSASVTVEKGVVEVLSLASGTAADIQAGQTVLVDAQHGHDLEVVSARERPAKDADDRERDVLRLARAKMRRMNRVMDRGEEQVRIAVELGDLETLDALADDTSLDAATTSLLDQSKEAEDRDTAGTIKIDPPVLIDPNIIPLPPQPAPGTNTGGTGTKKDIPRQMDPT